MKSISTFLLLFISFHTLLGQTTVTKELISSTEKLIDIELTDAERDSLITQAQGYLLTYKTMHAQKLENTITPALYFNPSVSMLPVTQTNTKPTVWTLPNKVDLPKNKADL